MTSRAKTRGVRRRREETGGAVEIEELDSATMRQSTYNYFQRKRRRTLTDFLDGLSLSRTNPADAAMAAADESDADADPDDDSERRHSSRELTLVGGGRGAAMKHFFFGGSRRRPMDRVFRHYAAVANHTCVRLCVRMCMSVQVGMPSDTLYVVTVSVCLCE